MSGPEGLEAFFREPSGPSEFGKGFIMRKNSVKNTRINGEVQRVLAETIRGEIKDPRISPWTSVVAVEVAPDLKSCKAWISVLGDEEARKATIEGLKSAEGFMRNKLARAINLRNTPEITFIMDQSIEYGVNMSHRIEEVVARDDENARNRGDEEPGTEADDCFDEDFDEDFDEEFEENFDEDSDKDFEEED